MMFRLSPVLLAALLAGGDARVGKRQLSGTKSDLIADLLKSLAQIDSKQNGIEIPEMEVMSFTEEEVIDQIDTPTVNGVDGDTYVDIPEMEAMFQEEAVDMVDTPNSYGGSDRSLRERSRSRSRTSTSTAAADTQETVEIPEMEPIPVNTEDAVDTVDTPTGDTPTIDGDSLVVDIPQMEAIPAEYAVSEEAVDAVDTPTTAGGDTRSAEGDDSRVDIPQMEAIPAEYAVSEEAVDTVDTPNELGFEGDSLVVDIPEMEAIPEEFLPENLPPAEEGFIEDTPTEPILQPGDAVDTPTVVEDVVMPWGANAEGYILTGGLAAVCATSQEEANQLCQDKLPICKYKVEGDVITSQVTSTEDCVRRCDSPLDDNHCESHQECFRFTFGCECSTLDFTGDSECTPF